MRTKKTLTLTILAVGVMVLSGCAKGRRELREGMAAELRGDWAAAEASYSASATAGNNEAWRKLTELWAGPRTEELLSRELKDAAWRDAVRSSMVKLANLGPQAEERGIPVEEVKLAVARLEEAIKASEEAERAVREAEERRLKEERRAERVRQLEERMAPLKTQCGKLDREKQRLENDLNLAQSDLIALIHQSVNLPASHQFMSEDEYKTKTEEIERRLDSAKARRDHLQSQLTEISAQFEECREELSSLQHQLDALQGRPRSPPPLPATLQQQLDALKKHGWLR